MMNKDLSIIIPCYNCQDTLNQAVDSCFKQNLKKIEIILVDDASTDKTSEIINSLSKKHPEIKTATHSKNMGGGATRNTAVRMCNSNVIFCLDSDDILPENTLGPMYECLLRYNAGGVGLHKSIKFNGTNIHDVSRIDTFGYTNEIIPIESLIEKKNSPLCPLYSVFMFTKNAFSIAGGYPENHGFDTQGFAWRFLLNNLTAYTCENTCYLHRINHSKSYYVRESRSGKINLNWIKIFSEFIDRFEDSAINLIVNFDINSDKNIIDEIKKLPNIFSKECSNKISLERKTYLKNLFSSVDRNNCNVEFFKDNINNYSLPHCLEISHNKKQITWKKAKSNNIFRRVIRKLKQYVSKN